MQFGCLAARDPNQACIVVNPRQLNPAVRMALENDRRVMLFNDLNDFERWRNRCLPAHDLTREVATVLRAIGQDGAQLPPMIGRAIERLARQSITPSVREFVKYERSERTFYRRWNELLPVRPKQFLDQVRFVHALGLMEEHGYSAKEAAAVAGYGSVDRLRADARATANAA